LHLSTLFLTARLKTVLEVRSSDTPPPESSMTVPAFWTGLFYHRPSLAAALDLVTRHRVELAEVGPQVYRTGLRTSMGGGLTLQDLARDLVELARVGLDARGMNESVYLEPAREWAADGRNAADRLAERVRAGGLAALLEATKLV
jgi:glutamate--cysteine ligase